MRAFTPLALGALLVLSGPVAGQSLDLGASVQYSRGSYIFSEPTETFSLYTAAGFRSGRFRIGVGLPLIMQDSRAITLVGGQPVPTGGPDHESVARRERGNRVPMGGGGSGQGTGGRSVITPSLLPGPVAQTIPAPADSVEAPGSFETHLGDPLVSASVEILSGPGTLRVIELTASAKPPLASLDSGVGTGEWDAGAGGSVVLGLGRTLFFADLAYWSYGDLPELELQDGLSWGLAAARPLGDRTNGMLSLWGGNRVIPTADPAITMSAMISRRLGDASSMALGVGRGFTESTPDLSVSISVRTTKGP
jgi:hypothetical protein